MEYSPQLDQLDDHSPVASTSGSRKRPAPDDSPSAEAKRAKARERQRRKRERDRAGMVAAYDANGAPQAEYGARAQQQPDEELTPEQLAKKERLKKAARERQRKHRAVVKAKRMAEMGLAMAVEGQLPAAGYHDAAAYAAAVHMHAQQHPDLHDDDPDAQLQHPDLPEQQPDASPGQTFASLVLLSFSCAPLLKQHLLRTLNMTSDELQSFGPILAASWERWNHDRTMQYQNDEDHGEDSPYVHQNDAELPSPYAQDGQQLHAESAPDYRQRYQRVPYGHASNHHPIDPALNGRGRDDELDSPLNGHPEIDPELDHTS